ncbi:MAG: hypothetical protein J6A69_11385 [Clostridia bacterium]|nr:hypothetical protein [Clostridia bacterium]
MNKKIVLSVVLILTLILSLASVSFAEGEFKVNLRVGEWYEDARTGEKVFDAFVSIENNPGLATVGYSVEFDKMLIQPVNVKKTDIISGSTTWNRKTYVPGVTDFLKISHFDTVNFYEDGEVHKITFKLTKYASASNSEQSVEIKLVENPTGRFYGEDSTEFVPVYGASSVVLPVIEGEGEIFDSENVDTPVDEGEAEDFEEIVSGITVPVNRPSHSEIKKYKTTIILTIDSVEIKVNNNALINDVAPIIVNDRTMLPVRIIAQELGVTPENIIWDEKAQKVTVITDEKKIEIYIDSSKAYVNGATVELDSPAFIQNDRTYLPLRFISENLGASVDWDEDLQQVTIKK